MSDGTEQHTVDGIEYSIYIWDECVDKVNSSGVFAGNGRTLTFLSCRKSRTERTVWLVALSCWRVMSGCVCRKGTTCGTDVFPVTHSVEIACMTTSSVRWCYDTPPQTMTDPLPQSIPLQSTGLCNAQTRIRPSPPVRQNCDLTVKSTFYQSCLDQRRWVCAHRRRCCLWCLVRTCLTTGLQALSPASLSLLQTVWALMEGLCVPGATRAVVAFLYLSCRCDVRMYRSCAGVATPRMISCPSCLNVALS
jgi:hypothetical protein